MKFCFKSCLFCSLSLPALLVHAEPQYTPEQLAMVQKNLARPANGAAPAAEQEYAHLFVSMKLARKEIDQAQSFVLSVLAKHPKDPVYLVEQGRIHQARGDWAGAAKSYDAASMQAQSMGIDKLWIAATHASASALAKEGKKDEAIAKIESLHEGGYHRYPRGVVEIFESSGTFPAFNNDEANYYVDLHQPKQVFSTSLLLGHDSNVALLPDSGAGSSGSLFMTPELSASSRFALLETPLMVAGTLAYTHNFAAAASDSNNIPLNIKANWGLPGDFLIRNKVSMEYASGYVFTPKATDKFFSNTHHFNFYKQSHYSEQGALTYRLLTGYDLYPGVVATGDDVRDGALLGVGIQHTHKVGRLLPLSQDVSYSQVFAKGNNYKHGDIGVSLSTQYPIVAGFNGVALLGFTYANYASSSTSRSDKIFNAMMQILKRYGTVDFALTYAYIHNASTDTNAKYSKNITSIKGSYEF